jgi:hypothetical protein
VGLVTFLQRKYKDRKDRIGPDCAESPTCSAWVFESKFLLGAQSPATPHRDSISSNKRVPLRNSTMVYQYQQQQQIPGSFSKEGRAMRAHQTEAGHCQFLRRDKVPERISSELH